MMAAVTALFSQAPLIGESPFVADGDAQALLFLGSSTPLAGQPGWLQQGWQTEGRAEQLLAEVAGIHFQAAWGWLGGRGRMLSACSEPIMNGRSQTRPQGGQGCPAVLGPGPRALCGV